MPEHLCVAGSFFGKWCMINSRFYSFILCKQRFCFHISGSEETPGILTFYTFLTQSEGDVVLNSNPVLYVSPPPPPGCDGCYLISMTSLIAVITSDIILTIFIMISVFCFATHQRRRRECDSLHGERPLTLLFFCKCGHLPKGLSCNHFPPAYR